MAFAATSAAVTMASTLPKALFNPLPLKPRAHKTHARISRTKGRRRLVVVKASSMKDKAVTGMTAAALNVSMLVPDVAEAAELSPSLKNFLLSIVAGGVVLTVIIGAVIAVSNFDPVKRD